MSETIPFDADETGFTVSVSTIFGVLRVAAKHTGVTLYFYPSPDQVQALIDALTPHATQEDTP